VVGEREFRAAFQGLLLRRGEADPEEIRKPRFNIARDANPLWWAVVKNEEDIQLCVRFAIANKFKIAVCTAGQHSWHSQSDDMLVDLRRFKGIHVDADNQLITFKMGHTLGEIDDAGAAAGQLHVPMGIVSHTGAGLVLGGGVGFLSRLHGATADHIVAGKVVLANGELVEANEAKHPDLLRSLRGGGGLTGIVTEITARAHKVPHAWVKVRMFEIDQLVAQFPRIKAFFDSPETQQERRATTYTIFGLSPEQKRVALILNVFVGPEDEAKSFFSTLQVENPIAVLTEGPIPFAALQKMNDGGFGPAVWYATCMSVSTPYVSEQVFREVAEAWKNDTAADTGAFVFEQRGGAWNENSKNTMMGTRDSKCDLVIFVGWKDVDAKDGKIAQFREYKRRFKACDSGLSDLKLPNMQLNRDHICEHDNVDEFRSLKQKYDPHGLFGNVFGV